MCVCGEQQLALSRGPGEGAGEEVSIAALLQRLPDTRSCGGGVQTIKKKQEAGIRDVEEDQTGMRALMVPVQTQCGSNSACSQITYHRATESSSRQITWEFPTA